MEPLSVLVLTLNEEAEIAECLESGARSQERVGRFRTAPRDATDVHLLWSGDTAGQGWGIDASRGGMRIYETMRRLAPDAFLHCGDLVYADGPMPEEIALPDGTTWRKA